MNASAQSQRLRELILAPETLRSIRDMGDFTEITTQHRLCGMETVGALLKRV